MVNQKKKGKYIGMAGALVVHVAIIALLILVGFTLPEPSEEGGVPVMLGEVPDALGAADPSLVKVDVMPEETAPQVQETVEQDIITQETEETVAIKPKAEPKKPGNAGMILLVLAVMGIGGGAAWYFKIYRPKHQQADQPEEDDGGEYPDYDEFEDDGPPWDEEDETEEKEEIR